MFSATHYDLITFPRRINAETSLSLTNVPVYIYIYTPWV